MSRYSDAVGVYGEAAVEAIGKARVLVIGAGGIGCELLKNLVLSGFRDIEVVDLDTIDVSNLNRQFLFRPQHVTKPKAVVAAGAVMTFNPDATVVAFHDNVKSFKFDVGYFGGFDLVMNALDNVAARRHVNRLCLAADKPLVEAGTAGYIGQSYVIKKGETQCFDCEPVSDRKTYPICTIRSTPEKPVHCVVWAKDLFKLVFGDPVTAEHLYDDNPDSDLMQAVKNPTAFDDATLHAFALRIFDIMFNLEVAEALRHPDKFKTAKHTPTPLVFDTVVAAPEAAAGAGDAPARPMLSTQVVPTVAQSAQQFVDAVKAFMSDEVNRARLGGTEFDKDVAVDLQFVTAATNLRAAVFGIDLQSPFEVKSIAGNIVPAIATTNAIVAGLEVLQAIRIVTQEGDIRDKCRYNYCSRFPRGRKQEVLQPVKLEAPIPNCFACSKDNRILSCALDTEAMTLEDFVGKVIKGHFSFNEPVLSLLFPDSHPRTIHEEGVDGEDASDLDRALLKQPVAKCAGGGIHHGSQVEVVDFSQGSLKVQLGIVHRATSVFEDAKSPQLFEVFDPVVGSKMEAPAGPATEEEEEEEKEDEPPAAKRARTAK